MNSTEDSQQTNLAMSPNSTNVLLAVANDI